MLLKNKAIFLLFVVILVEGYVVLSTELLAIRLTIPFLGTGTDTISIIIAAVLMPLAFGYFYGGLFKPYRNRLGEYVTVRKKLVSNITIALFFIVFATSYIPLNIFFTSLKDIGVTSRHLTTAIYAVVFLVVPVFLLGQTIPLISNFFTKRVLSRITGKMLFFSTLGSFLGAVFSTLVLMSFIGVHYTAVVNMVLLALLFFMMQKQFNIKKALPIIIVTLIGISLNTTNAMFFQGIVENNKYNTIKISDSGSMKVMSLNHNFSSGLSPDGKVFSYIEYVRKMFINKIPADDAPKNILVIGTGGFTLSLQDSKNIYDYVDIDGSLKRIAEDYFLEKKLTDNIHFHAVPIRAFLANSDKKYDMIALDAFTGATSTPEHLVTQEFFKQVHDALAVDGLLVANTVTNPNFLTAYSRHFDSTFRSVFPYTSRQIVNPYNGWDKENTRAANVIYSARKYDKDIKETIYKDNKNRIFYDKPM